MAKTHTLLEFVEKAVAILNDISKNSPDKKLWGPAYCLLATLCRDSFRYIPKETYVGLFKKVMPTSWCKLALQYGGSNTWVMTTCARIYRTGKKVDKAISILQRCLEVRRHTSTFHQLGLCYLSKAEEPVRKKQKSQAVNNVAACQVKEKPSLPLHKYATAETPLPPNEFVGEAEYNFLKAIRMSHGQNLPALYDLGMLYKLLGQNKKALESFNQVTNTGAEGHLINVIYAYEQAGLCYLEMGGQEKLAEDKLTKAISLAGKVAYSCPHLQDCALEMWRSVKIMKDRLESDDRSAVRDKKLIRFFELVKNYRSVVKVVEDLQAFTDSALKDPEVIRSGLTGYLELNEPEKALTMLNMIIIRPDITSSDWWISKDLTDLKNKVLLLAAWQRLQVQRSEARLVFQDLFKMYTEQSGSYGRDEATYICVPGDVLVFYDDDHDTETELSQISKTAQVLHSIFSQVFGLATSNNLEDCVKYGPVLAVRLEHMKRYRVVAVILGPENRDPVFEALLALIPHPSPRTQYLKQSVLIIDAGCGRDAVPEVLRACDYFELPESLIRLTQGSPEQDDDRDQTTVGDDIIKNMGGNLEAIMQLFCFLVKQKWPCD